MACLWRRLGDERPSRCASPVMASTLLLRSCTIAAAPWLVKRFSICPTSHARHRRLLMLTSGHQERCPSCFSLRRPQRSQKTALFGAFLHAGRAISDSPLSGCPELETVALRLLAILLAFYEYFACSPSITTTSQTSKGILFGCRNMESCAMSILSPEDVFEKYLIGPRSRPKMIPSL